MHVTLFTADSFMHCFYSYGSVAIMRSHVQAITTITYCYFVQVSRLELISAPLVCAVIYILSAHERYCGDKGMGVGRNLVESVAASVSTQSIERRDVLLNQDKEGRCSRVCFYSWNWIH